MSVEKLIGVCGIVCSECGAYLATKNHDENLRRVCALSRTPSQPVAQPDRQSVPGR